MNLQGDSRERVGCPLSRHVEVLVVGGHAVAFHGQPRLTEDMDLPVRPTRENGRRIVEALSDFGFASLGRAAGRPQDLADAERLESGPG